MYVFILLTGLIGLLIGGCHFEPPYEVPSTAVTESWKNQSPATAQTVSTIPEMTHWWEVFGDARLNEFIGKVLENNQNLLAAAERVEQARDVAKIARSKLFPQFNLNPSYSNQTVLSQLYGPGIPNQFTLREHQLEYALPVTMTYELDLWGKIRSAYKAGKLNAEAQNEAFKTTQLMLTTDLANAYFQVRLLDAQIDLLETIVSTRKKAFTINQSRYAGQLISYNPVALSQQDLSGVESDYFEAKQKRAAFENTIAVLLGENPSTFTLDPMPFTELPPVIPAGVPSMILLRRPDLAQQERAMAAIHAKLGIVYASYFPSIDLTAVGGFLSPLSGEFLKGVSNYWMIGANITEVIFDGLARKYNVKLTWAQFREAVALYRQGVLTAFQEVETALSNLAWISKQMETIELSVTAAETDYLLSSDRYRYGVSSYLPVVNTEWQELNRQRTQLTLLSARYANTIQLIKALGGGW